MNRGAPFSRAGLASALCGVAMLSAGACTAQKAPSSAASDTSTATVPVPAATPAPVAAPEAPTAKDSVKMRKPEANPPAAGGERDSAVQATFEIGADGKLRRVKR